MIKSSLALSVLVLLSACATPMRSPAMGVLYTDTAAGLAVSSNQTGNRVGESCASSILGLVGTGDASIEAARRNGGITTISTVDESFHSYLGLYAKQCTTVRGR